MNQRMTKSLLFFMVVTSIPLLTYNISFCAAEGSLVKSGYAFAASSGTSCTYFSENFSGSSGNTWDYENATWNVVNGELSVSNIASGYIAYAGASFAPDNYFTIDTDASPVSLTPSNGAYGMYVFTTGSIYITTNGKTYNGVAVFVWGNSVDLDGWDVNANTWVNVGSYTPNGALSSIGLEFTSDAVTLRANKQNTTTKLSTSIPTPSLFNKFWLLAQGSGGLFEQGTQVNFDNVCAGPLTTYTQPPAAQSPVVSFEPPSNSLIVTSQPFDFSFSIDFGSYPELDSFSIKHQNMDITGTFLNAIFSGYVKVAINGSVVTVGPGISLPFGLNGSVLTVTLPGISLPVGQHRVTIAVSSPGGATVANWVATVSAQPASQVPRFSLSNDQKQLIAAQGNPQYLTIGFNPDPLKREETWVYTDIGKMYTFWDGSNVNEQTITLDSTLRSNPPSLDPSLFAKDTKLSDIVQVFGSNYTTIDQTNSSFISNAPGFKTYYFADMGLLASFEGDSLAVVQTVDVSGIVHQEAVGGQPHKVAAQGDRVILAVSQPSNSFLDYDTLFLFARTFVFEAAGVKDTDLDPILIGEWRISCSEADKPDDPATLNYCKGLLVELIDYALQNGVGNRDIIAGLGMYLLLQEDNAINSTPPWTSAAGTYSGPFSAAGQFIRGVCTFTVTFSGTAILTLRPQADGTFAGEVNVTGNGSSIGSGSDTTLTCVSSSVPINCTVSIGGQLPSVGWTASFGGPSGTFSGSLSAGAISGALVIPAAGGSASTSLTLSKM